MHGKAPGRISHRGPEARARSAALLRLRAGCVPHPVRRRRRPFRPQDKRSETRSDRDTLRAVGSAGPGPPSQALARLGRGSVGLRPEAPARRRRTQAAWRGSGPLPGDLEVAELVLQPPGRGELGRLRRLERLEGGRPAGCRVAPLLLGREERPAEPVVVLRLDLQAANHVLLRLRRHGSRPPVLPDPLPAGDAAAAQERGQEHGACRGHRSGSRQRAGHGEKGEGSPAAARRPTRPRPNTHQPRLTAALLTPAHDAGSRKPEAASALSRRAARLLARGFSSREKGLARVAEPMAFPAPGFKRARALRTSVGLVHGSDPGLLREAAVSGRHPGRRDGSAASSAGRRGQR